MSRARGLAVSRSCRVRRQAPELAEFALARLPPHPDFQSISTYSRLEPAVARRISCCAPLSDDIGTCGPARPPRYGEASSCRASRRRTVNRSNMEAPPLERKLVAILAADVEGDSRSHVCAYATAI